MTTHSTKLYARSTTLLDVDVALAAVVAREGSLAHTLLVVSTWLGWRQMRNRPTRSKATLCHLL